MHYKVDVVTHCLQQLLHYMVLIFIFEKVSIISSSNNDRIVLLRYDMIQFLDDFTHLLQKYFFLLENECLFLENKIYSCQNS